jgi:hypothetical protein
VQILRMVASPGMMTAAAPDPTAPKGPGFEDGDGKGDGFSS